MATEGVKLSPSCWQMLLPLSSSSSVSLTKTSSYSSPVAGSFTRMRFASRAWLSTYWMSCTSLDREPHEAPYMHEGLQDAKTIGASCRFRRRPPQTSDTRRLYSARKGIAAMLVRRWCPTTSIWQPPRRKGLSRRKPHGRASARSDNTGRLLENSLAQQPSHFPIPIIQILSGGPAPAHPLQSVHTGQRALGTGFGCPSLGWAPGLI